MQIFSKTLAANSKREERLMSEDEISKGGEMNETHEVTQLLLAWRAGEHDALDKLLPLVYDVLRRISRNQLNRERSNHTLQTTALVHEAYLKLINQENVNWQNRAHFFAIAAQAMRRILLDYARRHIAEKRGGLAQQISFDQADAISVAPDENLLALDTALEELAAIDEQQARVVELRYFGGLTVEETAEVLNISPRTVKREWAMARAWLYGALAGESSEAKN